jgi:hypothetical protein
VTADLVDRALAVRGGLLAVSLDEEPDAFLDAIRDQALGLGDGHREVHVRLVLGQACRTAHQAVPHLVAALQLPYAASRGWSDLLEALSDREVSRQEVVVVADAADLLRHEDLDTWRELVRSLFTPYLCLGGGWQTLVLVDSTDRWARSRFGSAADAEAAAAHPAA